MLIGRPPHAGLQTTLPADPERKLSIEQRDFFQDKDGLNGHCAGEAFKFTGLNDGSGRAQRHRLCEQRLLVLTAELQSASR